jgi:hypothetical protein
MDSLGAVRVPDTSDDDGPCQRPAKGLRSLKAKATGYLKATNGREMLGPGCSAC